MAVKTEFSLQYETADDTNCGLPVIIVAGGSSTRMNGIDKITAELAGIPVIVRTMLAFERSDYISQIIVVIKDEKIALLQDLANRFMITKLKGIAVGGNSRADSVLNGLKFLDASTDFVLVHDGARPLVDSKLIKRVACADKKYSCVICANKCIDTIKNVKDNIVQYTPERDKLVSVQTPQRLNYKKYIGYIEQLEDRQIVTDDASIMEKFGEEVFVVDGDYCNIKITSPLDLKIAEVLLKELF